MGRFVPKENAKEKGGSPPEIAHALLAARDRESAARATFTTATIAAGRQAADFPFADTCVAFVGFFLDVANADHLAAAGLAGVTGPIAATLSRILTTRGPAAAFRAASPQPIEAGQAGTAFAPGADDPWHTHFLVFDLPAVLLDCFSFELGDTDFTTATATVATAMATLVAATHGGATSGSAALRFAPLRLAAALQGLDRLGLEQRIALVGM